MISNFASRFWIEGITSTSCPDSVEAALNQLPSRKRAFVALITECSEVEHYRRQITIRNS